MPDSTNTIWIDTRFFSSSSYDVNTNVEYKTYEANNIGGRLVTAEYVVSDSYNFKKNITNEYYYGMIDSASTSSLVDFSLVGVGTSGTTDLYNNYYQCLTTISGYEDLVNTYSTGYNVISGAVNNIISYTPGSKWETGYYLPNAWFSPYFVTSGVNDYVTNYTNFSTVSTVSGTPIPSIDHFYNIPTKFTTGSGYINYDSLVWEIFFAGWLRHYFTSDVFSTDLSLDDVFNTDITTTDGSVDGIFYDLFSTDLKMFYLASDVFCSLLDYDGLLLDVPLEIGRINSIYTDLFSSEQEKSGLPVDVDLYSLKITNFSLSVSEYTEAFNFISVDVVDDVCPVSVSGTHFVLNGSIVNTTYSGITDGYRFFYDPFNDFSSLHGPTKLTVYAENNCGKSLEENFYLTFGYIVEYKNDPNYFYNSTDYGFGNEVVSRISAENHASCPKSDALAWKFETKELVEKDLGSRINCIGGTRSGYSDISSEIYPNSTAYFYGKDFVVTVNVKDFAGNYMDTFVLNYKIEDD